MSVRLCVCLCVSVCLRLSVCFNVQQRPLMVRRGETGSLFGFSVAVHQRNSSHMLLVGAPKDRAEPGVSANRTGGVYSCPITANDKSACSRMNLIGSDSDLDESEDLIEDMWLGVTVASQMQPRGRVLVCGHRFMKLYGVQKLRQMIGKCYLRGNDLELDPNDPHWQNVEQVCSHLGDVRGSEVMCNMGISAFISQDDIIVGSPGSYEWQGNVHVSWMNPDVLYDTQRTSFANLNQRHIYIGYSVTQATRLLFQDAITIVTGAPKDSKEDGRGSVILAVTNRHTHTPSYTHNTQYTARTRTPTHHSAHAHTLQPVLRLRGEQMGSYYGNSLAVTDLNNDGWNDLLVGAPYYFHRAREEGGGVYVYMNRGGMFGPAPDRTLRGPTGSAFGMALVAAGDLDQDGFQDVAIGAPFHGTGSVMIYTGSSRGLSEKPSQVIEGSQVSPGFSTFGYSLAGGTDVDGNKYPDLLIGSLDDQVALLRSHGVVYLTRNLSVTPEVIDPENCDYCVQVQVCASYVLSTGDRSFKKNIRLLFSVTADVTRQKPRLRFRDNGKEVYTGFLSMPSCRTLDLTVLTPVKDQVEPLKFLLSASLDQNQPVVLSPWQQGTNTTQVHMVKACGSDHRCHSNLQMIAQFTNQDGVALPSQQGAVLLRYDSSVKKLLLVVMVTNVASPGRPAEDAHAALLNVTRGGAALKYSGVRTKGPGAPPIECSDEDRVLLCELGAPFRSNHKVELSIIFEVSEISLNTREIHTQLSLSTLSEQSDLSPLSLTLLVEYSLQAVFTLIKQPGHAHFGGHVTGESSMKTTSDVGTKLDFTFKVEVLGKPLGDLGYLEVEFDWPWETSNGKWLLYLTEIRLDGTSESRCVPPGDIINPLNLLLSEGEGPARGRGLAEGEGPGRIKRSLEEETKEKRKTPSAFSLQGAPKSTHTLDCVQGSVRCVKFICPLFNMKTSANLTVSTRIWNSTMIEDYAGSWKVMVGGQASLKLVSHKPTVTMETITTQFSVLLEPEGGAVLQNSAPLWILLLSVLCGVLLLSTLWWLLWKCGFFQRGMAYHQGVAGGRSHCTADGFLIHDDITSSTDRKRKWITSWSETC